MWFFRASLPIRATFFFYSVSGASLDSFADGLHVAPELFSFRNSLRHSEATSVARATTCVYESGDFAAAIGPHATLRHSGRLPHKSRLSAFGRTPFFTTLVQNWYRQLATDPALSKRKSKATRGGGGQRDPDVCIVSSIAEPGMTSGDEGRAPGEHQKKRTRSVALVSRAGGGRNGAEIFPFYTLRGSVQGLRLPLSATQTSIRIYRFVTSLSASTVFVHAGIACV